MQPDRWRYLHMTCLTLLIIWKMQIKTTSRYHRIWIRMATMKTTRNNKCCKDVEKRSRIINWDGHYGKEYGKFSNRQLALSWSALQTGSWMSPRRAQQAPAVPVAAAWLTWRRLHGCSAISVSIEPHSKVFLLKEQKYKRHFRYLDSYKSNCYYGP